MQQESQSRQRVRLVIPADLAIGKSPKYDGEQYGFVGQTGTVLCNAAPGAKWVRFDGQGPYQYVGCLSEWLVPVEQ